MNDIYIYEHKAKKYKYKYLKLKNVLEGGNMTYGLYGLNSYYGNNLNLRTNQRFNEINYVHDLPLNNDKYIKDDNIIIQHLRDNCTIDHTNNNITEYYPNIESFKFVPYRNIDQNDYDKIQNLIDTTYFTKELYKDINGNVKWTELNKLKIFRYKGYSDEISEQIINAYTDKATQLLADETYKSDKDGITEIREKTLNLRSQRRCNEIHNYPDKSPNSSNFSSYEKILLDETIKDNEIQLLLSSVPTGIKYDNHPRMYKDPFTLANEKLGILSWNLIINKATINCLMNHHKILFPIRIILDMNPEKLFYDNILQTERSSEYIIEKNKYSNYMGFFLIKFINDKDDKYTHNSRPHISKEQYYIFFIFKNYNKYFDFPLHTYTLTNFRNNIVNWGTVTEKRTVLFYEIFQLICMYRKNKVYFYLISKKNSENKSENIKSWIYSDHLDYINFNNEIHILVSKYDIESVARKLSRVFWDKWDKVDGKSNTIYRYIDYDDDHELIECHFGYYFDPKFSKDSKDRFCIKLGNMNENTKENLENIACINDINSNVYKLDKVRVIKPIGENNIIEIEDIHNFDLNDDPIMSINLKDILSKM
jgi:hypothetical protein